MADPYAEFQAKKTADPYAEFSSKPASSDPSQAPQAINPAPPQTIGHAAGEFFGQVNPLSILGGVAHLARHPLDTAKAMWDAGDPYARRVMPLVKQGRYTEAIGNALAGTIPVIGPAAGAVADKLGGTEAKFDRYGNVVKPGEAPDIAGGLGGAAGLVAPILAGPAVARGLGKAAEVSARPLVKSALGLPGKAEAYGATPAKAVLEETPFRAVRPATIENAAREQIGTLSKQRAGLPAVRDPSLAPTRDLLKTESSKAAGFNSKVAPREISPMQEQLVQPRPGFQGRTEYPSGSYTPISFEPRNSSILGPSGKPLPAEPALVRGTAPSPGVAATQPPNEFAGMREQFDRDFIRNWNPAASTKDVLGVARKAYRSLSDEYHAAVPGSEGIDQRISSLIPAAERARLTDLNAGAVERGINRATRPTGGLFPLLFGYYEHGLPGAAAMIAGQETLGSPTAKMIAARNIYGLGKGLGSAAGQRTLQAAPFVRTGQ